MTNQPFFLGVNYPWANYAEDFGAGPSGHRGLSLPENVARVGEEFARIRDCGAAVVRWFLFADGRGGFVSEKGIPLRPDGFLFADVRAALELAREYQLKICFSLIDYLWLQDRTGKPAAHANEQVLQFAAGREAFLQRVLIPLFREFREHPALFAWEIANEPEWAIREFHRQPAALGQQLHHRGGGFIARGFEAEDEGHSVASLHRDAPLEQPSDDDARPSPAPRHPRIAACADSGADGRSRGTTLKCLDLKCLGALTNSGYWHALLPARFSQVVSALDDVGSARRLFTRFGRLTRNVYDPPMKV